MDKKDSSNFVGGFKCKGHNYCFFWRYMIYEYCIFRRNYALFSNLASRSLSFPPLRFRVREQNLANYLHFRGLCQNDSRPSFPDRLSFLNYYGF